MKKSLILLITYLLLSSLSIAQTTLSVADPSSSFTVFLGKNGNVLSDAPSDQQTGQFQSDFVGDASTPGFMYKSGLVDGNEALMFRTRLNSFSNNTNNLNVRIGVDTNLDGAMNLFFGFAGGTSEIRFFEGTGLNVSPSTSQFSALPNTLNISTSALNFQYEQTTNVFAGGTNDALLTFIVTFSQINAALNEMNAAPISTNSFLRFSAVTSTQSNTVNQDVYGLGNIKDFGSVRYDSFTEIYRGDGFIIPEPAMAPFLMLSYILTFLLLRRKPRA